MEKTYQYLKLRFAGLTTNQIYKLLLHAPSFLEESIKEQIILFKRFLLNINCRNKFLIYNKFTNYSIEALGYSLLKNHIHFVGIHQHAYPALLREIYNPPVILFYKGNLQMLSTQKTLAVIGSRNATQYTKQSLSLLFPYFKAQNLCIVSGLARGADCIAHQLALQNGLPAIAVLGFGHKQHYPKQTFEIRQQIEQIGIVISEYLPDEPPKKYHFPERNRIISGLSKGVLITESTERSGTLITTEHALEQNRNVYVLPGTIFDPLVRGNLKSAQEGAKIVIKASDILEDFI
ncbi:DNA-processing protein DprA [Staphylococcus sp. ACRSN]|uniref:DNA-processing protein DprA n=1 Tax=Staphylococcus sp. ACRSN TaxID=2918214 RepID=UPI001EF1D25F|nr:DNA-processing protein DprA [Staphylococcus sp. ACRSN]MCG7338645.1 DNA-processing protein DprA [Staphylococcus sp. ACRSN]